MTKYNPITPAILEQLQQTVGEKYTLMWNCVTIAFEITANWQDDKVVLNYDIVILVD